MPAQVTRFPRSRARTMDASAIPVAEGLHEEVIRARAYEIFLARNGAPGNPESDWRQAEEELRGRMTLLGQT
jgi:hypothetical protein